MTKSTFKVLWLGGGGLLATWFAVTPSDTPGKAKITVAERPAAIHEVTADNLIAQEARLREHAGSVPLGSSTRNPFRFGSKKAADAMQPSAAAPAATTPVVPAPVQPSLNLAGIAERQTPQGVRRMAIISGDGQLYLVTEGEMVAG